MYQKPVIEVNHIMGHVFSILLERSLDQIQLPYVCLTVSGGHNDLYFIENAAEKKTEQTHIHLPALTKHQHLAV